MRKSFLSLLLMLALIGCAVRSGKAPEVSVKKVEGNPEAFRDKLVRVRGYGVMMATVPLCPGYVGLDQRAVFVDAEGSKITAQVPKNWPENIRIYEPEKVRTFEGYIRIFSGEVGCPGSTRKEVIPYFEITGVVP